MISTRFFRVKVTDEIKNAVINFLREGIDWFKLIGGKEFARKGSHKNLAVYIT